MILAVPMMAVIRIYLDDLHHPLAKWLALKLAGRDADEAHMGKAAVAPL